MVHHPLRNLISLQRPSHLEVCPSCQTVARGLASRADERPTAPKCESAEEDIQVPVTQTTQFAFLEESEIVQDEDCPVNGQGLPQSGPQEPIDLQCQPLSRSSSGKSAPSKLRNYLIDSIKNRYFRASSTPRGGSRWNFPLLGLWTKLQDARPLMQLLCRPRLTKIISDEPREMPTVKKAPSYDITWPYLGTEISPDFASNGEFSLNDLFDMEIMPNPLETPMVFSPIYDPDSTCMPPAYPNTRSELYSYPERNQDQN